MKSMNVKKLAAVALLGVFAAGSGFAIWSAGPSFAAAGRHHNQQNCEQPRREGCPAEGNCVNRQPDGNCQEGQGHKGQPKGAGFHGGAWAHGKMNHKEMSERMAKDFGLEAGEILTACQEKRDFRDIMHAAVVAKASGQPFAHVIRLKTAENSWGDVEAAMRVSPDMLKSVREDMMSAHMAEKMNLDKNEVKGLLAEGYHPRDIRCASVIAKLSNTGVKKILKEKKINNRWHDVAKAHDIDGDAFRKAMHDSQGPGEGFHRQAPHNGGHRPMTLPANEQ